MPVLQRRRFELRPTPPYDFALAADYIRTSPSAVLERVAEDGTYRRALALDGRDVLVTVRPAGTPDEPRLAVELAAATLDDATLDDATVSAAEARLRTTFNLDADVRPFHATAGRDPVFASLVRRRPGLRPILLADPFECLIWAVLGQQVNVTFARKLKYTLTLLAGRTLTVDGETYWLAPRPEDMAALDPAMLRASHQFSTQKAAYVTALARAARDGEIDFAALAAMPTEEAIASLTRFKGVGRWTAEYLLMRGLGARDIIPAGDLGLQAVIGAWHGLGRKASETEVRAYAEAWAPWRGWAAFFWWYSLQLRLSPPSLS